MGVGAIPRLPFSPVEVGEPALTAAEPSYVCDCTVLNYSIAARPGCISVLQSAKPNARQESLPSLPVNLYSEIC